MFLDNRLVIGISTLIVAFIIYKVIISFAKKTSDYEKELEKVITSEEFKVKGRHE
jgi:hypothetical protein